MRDVTVELKALRLHGMAGAWFDLQEQGPASGLDTARWLRGTDIELERSADGEAYWLVRIASATASGSGDARLKNLQSNRRLPVMVGTVPDLDAFLNSRVGTSERLFPNLTPDRYDKLSTAASKVLNRRLDQIFPNRDKPLVFQSLRTTAAVAMRSAEICGPRRVRFLGHAPESVHQRHYEADYQLDADDLLPAARAIASREGISARPNMYAPQVSRTLKEARFGAPIDKRCIDYP